MPRKPRNELEPGTAHVWARGVEKRRIFGDDEDRQLYLRLLIGAAARYRWHCLAYCLMPNHVHLLIETTQPNLAQGIQLVHGRYAQSSTSSTGASDTSSRSATAVGWSMTRDSWQTSSPT